MSRASSSWGPGYTPNNAIDDYWGTRWNSGQQPGDTEWIELGFPKAIRFNRVDLFQYDRRIQGHRIEHWDGTHWVADVIGDTLPAHGIYHVPATTTTRVRFVATHPAIPVSLWEIGVSLDGVRERLPLISEWMLHNVAFATDPADGLHKPWFELWNPGDEPTDLSGYYLSDDPRSPFKSLVPQGVVLAPGERRVVWCGGAAGLDTRKRSLHVGFLPKEQGTIGLYTAEGIAVNVVELDPQDPDRSSGIPDAGNDAILALARPSPGAPNTPLETLPVRRDPTHARLRLEFRGTPFTTYRIECSGRLDREGWETYDTVESDEEGLFHEFVKPVPGASRLFRAALREDK